MPASRQRAKVRRMQHHRLGRILAAALAVSMSLGVSLASAPKAVAVDCSYYWCAMISMSLSGSGSAHVTDSEGVIDCYYAAGVYTGACKLRLGYWISDPSPVTFTISASPDSYACDANNICAGPGASKTDNYYLLRYQNGSGTTTVYGEANLAKAATVSIDPYGDGSGRVITSPPGIDCSVTAGTGSGGCSHRFYFRDSLSITFTIRPDSGSYGCFYEPTDCSPVGGAFSRVFNFTTTDADALRAWFTKGHPILTVGVSGQGTVLSNPSGISCPSTCSRYFAPNTNLTLSAAAKIGYGFDHWTGACAGYQATCNVALGTTDASTTAVFVPTATPAPTATPRATTSPGPTPSALPGATPTPRPSIGAGTPPAVGGGGSFLPADSAGPGSNPGGSPDAAATGELAAVSNAPSSAGPLGGAIASARSTVDPANPGAGTEAVTQSAGPDFGLIILLVIVVLVLGVGIGVGTVAAATRVRRRPS